MSAIGASFNGSIFSKDFPIIIATNRSSAILLPVRLKYDSDGYLAGTVLARLSADGMYVKYDDNGSGGEEVAKAVLFEAHPVEDFDLANASGSTMAVGIFGGCTVFYDKLVGIDANAITDLKGTEITDATGVVTLKF